VAQSGVTFTEHREEMVKIEERGTQLQRGGKSPGIEKSETNRRNMTLAGFTRSGDRG